MSTRRKFFGATVRRWSVVGVLVLAGVAPTTPGPGTANASTGPTASRSGSSPAVGASHSARPRGTPAPLTLATFVVTDLATGARTTYSSSSVSYRPSCGWVTNLVCIVAGSASFTLSTPNQPWFSYDDSIVAPGAIGSVSANGVSCGDGVTATQSFAVTYDQVEFDRITGTAYQWPLAFQFDCVNDGVQITGTIAYQAGHSDPFPSYYVYNQSGDLYGHGFGLGYLPYLGTPAMLSLNSPIVGMAVTSDVAGYWMVGGDGGVFAYGDAGFYGSTGSLHLNRPVVDMAATPDGKGYWFVASDGGIFAYGDAGFYGSTGNLHLNQPVVGMAATPDGKGYWLVASDGGIFAYGDAGFYGSTGNLRLNRPVVGMAASPDGKGYWFVASDGGIFAYGDAGFYGSAGGLLLTAPIVGMSASSDGKGYSFAASDGGIFAYGDAPFYGSLGGIGTRGIAGIAVLGPIA